MYVEVVSNVYVIRWTGCKPDYVQPIFIDGIASVHNQTMSMRLIVLNRIEDWSEQAIHGKTMVHRLSIHLNMSSSTNMSNTFVFIFFFVRFSHIWWRYFTIVNVGVGNIPFVYMYAPHSIHYTTSNSIVITIFEWWTLYNGLEQMPYLIDLIF